MAAIRVGLMGLGRIGRDLLRILHPLDDIQIAAVSDPAEDRALEYLLRFDTILGRFPGELNIRDSQLHVQGQTIPVLHRAQDEQWGDLGVQVVVEATGQSRSREEVQVHLDRGAERVIMCVPPKDAPEFTVVMGVNDAQLQPEHRIVSNGSCTAHCAAPVIQILHQEFGIRRAFLTTTHAYTNQQRLADVPTEDKRRGRAAAENIIPQSSNAAQVVMELLPELHGRISAMAMNVPVPNGSVVDLVCWHERPVTTDAVNQAMRSAAAGRWKGIVAYEDQPIVSSDIVRSPASCTFDSLATMTQGEHVSKTLSWFDNSWGYVHRVMDLIRRFAEMDAS